TVPDVVAPHRDLLRLADEHELPRARGGVDGAGERAEAGEHGQPRETSHAGKITARASARPTARVMVRPMKLTGRTGIMAIVLFVAVAAGILGAHVFTTSRAPAGIRCPTDPRVALGCYERRYRSLVAGQGVAEAFAD